MLDEISKIDELIKYSYTHGSTVVIAWERIKKLACNHFSHSEKMVYKNTAMNEFCPCCTGDGIGANESGWVRCTTCGGTGKLYKT